MGIAPEITARIAAAQERYAKTEEAGKHWLTLGAKNHHGGTHVQVDGAGDIVTGPPALKGNNVSKPFAPKAPDWFKGKGKAQVPDVGQGAGGVSAENPQSSGSVPAEVAKPKQSHQFSPEEMQKINAGFAARLSRAQAAERELAQQNLSPEEMAQKHSDWNTANNQSVKDAMKGKAPVASAPTPEAASLDAPKPFFKPEEMAIPKEAAKQPVAPDAGYSALAQKGQAGNHELQQFLDFGHGVGSQLGYETIEPGKYTEEQIAKRLEQPGGVVMLAPVKGEKRSVEKVTADYGGDWSKLLDIARATIAVDTVDEVHQVIDKLRQNGVKWAKAPKDRFTKPPDQTGYRDILTNVVMPNGVVAELQIHLKPMLVAKAAGHHQYETMRSIDSRIKIENRDMNAEEESAYNNALLQSQKIYGEAWAKSTGGESPSGDVAKKSPSPEMSTRLQRAAGESEKQFAKRAAAESPAPKELPEDPGSYFDLSGPHKVVPMSALRSTKSDEENQQGGGNAPKLMDLARRGVLGKRAPITVRPNGSGGYDVVDGNGTFTGAKAYGWKNMPVQIESA